MADALGLEERLRRLEQSRNALALEVRALHHREAERDDEKARNDRWVRILVEVFLIVFVYCAVNILLIWEAARKVLHP